MRNTPTCDKLHLTEGVSPESLASPLWWLQQVGIIEFQLEVCSLQEFEDWTLALNEVVREYERLVQIEAAEFDDYQDTITSLRADL